MADNENDPLLGEKRKESSKRLKVLTVVGVCCVAVIAIVGTVVGIKSTKKHGSKNDRQVELQLHQYPIHIFEDNSNYMTERSSEESYFYDYDDEPNEDCEIRFEPLSQEELSKLVIDLDQIPLDAAAPFTAEELAWLLQGINETDRESRRVRKEVRTLSAEEWQLYGKAVRKMKSTYPSQDSRSEYDILVGVHSVGISPFAHFGPTVLPWHRVYLDKFESVLITHEPSISLPYWDTVLDEYLHSPSDSVLWTDELFGPHEGEIISGPFAGHTNPPGYCKELLGTLASRSVVQNTNSILRMLSNEMIDYAVLRHRTYSDFMKPAKVNWTQDASSLIELHHGGVHASVGGDMAVVPCAPVDPIFFLWHASLDQLFEEFRQKQHTDPETEWFYDPKMDPGYKALAPMEPFTGLQNIWGLSNHFTQFRYEYIKRPSRISCRRDKDCGSNEGFLWCDVGCYTCRSRIKEGGNCKGFPDHACFCQRGGSLGIETTRCGTDDTCKCIE